MKQIAVALLLFCLAAPLYAQKGMGLSQYVQGEDHRKNKRYNEAVIAYNKAVQAEPTNPDYLFQLGLCYREMKMNEKAVETYKRLIEVKKEYYKAYGALGRLQSTVLKQYEPAVQTYVAGATFAPDKNIKMDYLLNAITILHRLKRYNDIPTYIEQGKGIDPENPELIYAEARNNNLLEKYQDVENSLTKFLATPQINTKVKDLPKYYYELALAYYRTRQFAKLEQVVPKADFGPLKPKVFELKPDYFYSLANVYFKVYDYGKSEELLKQVLEMKAAHKEGNELATRLKEAQKDKTAQIKTAIDSIGKLSDAGRRSAMYCNLCRLQFDAGEFPAAAASAEECLRNNQKNIPFIFYKAIAKYRSGDVETAVVELDKISKAPQLDVETRSLFFFALGLVYKEAKDPKMAAGFFRKASAGSFEHAAKAEFKAMMKGDPKAEEEEPTDE